MSLEEYIDLLHERVETHKAVGSQAPVAGVFSLVAEELSGITPGAQSRHLTTVEAAKITPWTSSYIAQLCREGKLPNATRPNGGCWAIPREDIRDLMACNKPDTNLACTPSLID